ncbi:MAG TPA: OmpA family protein [Pyrinomonadaceae bacterium]|nr:OmpA family protein [Pyrinomonadaceae bacterium]
MRSSKTAIQLILPALILVLVSVAFGQDATAPKQSRDTTSNARTRSVPDREQFKIEGIVAKLDGNVLMLRRTDQKETAVVFTPETDFKLVRKGLFRRDQTTGATQILRGLRLIAEGADDADGHFIATKIRFDEQDLKTAQALVVRVDPVEEQANSTQALAESNRERISETEQNAKRLAGQVDELNSVAIAAGTAAKNAQETADQAQTDATAANQRISELDQYEVLQLVMVHFKAGSARLFPAAKAQIDEAVSLLQREDLKGLAIEVTGHADASGPSDRNRSLSERRAKVVVDYLVTQYNLPLPRLVQPYGYGEQRELVSNDTVLGRALNRRTEIKFLINRGIASRASSEQTSAAQLPRQQ